MDASEEGYQPGPDFEEDDKNPLIDISLTDSTELWLIQWPINQLQPADFQGKELSLKLHRDGELGSFESSSGKSYDVTSFAAHEPDATVFLASASESKVVGKISRRVCLVRYPEPGELEKPSLSHLNLSSQRSEGSLRRSVPRYSATPNRGTDRVSHDTLTSAHTIGQRSEESPQRSRHRSSRHRKGEERTPCPEVPMRSAERASHASEITNTSLRSSEKSHVEKSRKKKKIKVED